MTQASLLRHCSWEIIHSCNYRCPYCFFIPSWEIDPAGTNGKHLQCSQEDWLKFWDRLGTLYGPFHIEVSGGEPFGYPGFENLIARISRRHWINVITNLSWEVERALAVLGPDRVSFLASFHPHFSRWPEFSSRLARLREAGFRVSSMMVAYPPLFERLDEFLRGFEDLGIPCVIAPFQGALEGRPYPESYSAEQRERLRVWRKEEPPERFGYAVKESSPLGRLCGAGSVYFRAYPDGSVYRCVSLKDLPGSVPLGHIKDPVFRLNPGAAPCPANYCLCSAEYIHIDESAAGR